MFSIQFDVCVLLAALAVLPLAPVALADSLFAETLDSEIRVAGFPERPADVDPQRWETLHGAVAQAKLLPSPAGVGGPYGQFGYSVSISGNRALVGGIGLASSGAAIVFEDTGSGWVETAVLRPLDGEGGDQFGVSVSLSGDRALVGAWFDDTSGSQSGAAYVFDFDGTAWVETAKLVASDGAFGDRFGVSVSLSGDRALIGAFSTSVNDSDSGAAYVFDFDGTAWVQTAKLAASDGARDDQFGLSVSLAGDRALIGAHLADGNGPDSGAAYVFNFDGTNWVETTKLIASDAAARNLFGISVSLSGNRALVGQFGDDSQGPVAGAAYIFEFDGAVWSETAKLTSSSGALGDHFGIAVSLSGDRALISAPNENLGAAYVFDFDGALWSETAILTASNGSMWDQFGNGICLSGDRVLIGAFEDDLNGDRSGLVYVFDFNGAAWSETDTLTAREGAVGDTFGISVSLFGDRALIGASQDSSLGNDSGAAYVFDFDGTAWVETAQLVAGDTGFFDRFGISVSLWGDRALIGAYKADGNYPTSGAAYVFDFDGTAWVETAKLMANDGRFDHQFGKSVSLSGDRALIGAVNDDTNGSRSGSAYVFVFDGGGWREQAKLTPLDGEAGDEFGTSVSLSGDRALVGTPFNEDNGSGSGAAYVFDSENGVWNEIVKLAASDGATSDQFGFSVSLSGDRVLIGAFNDDANGSASGSAYVFAFDGTSWSETTKLTAFDGAPNDQFGRVVSLFGNVALVGAFLDDDRGTDSGSAYVFETELLFRNGFEND